jgi:hypothetical protein
MRSRITTTYSTIPFSILSTVNTNWNALILIIIKFESILTYFGFYTHITIPNRILWAFSTNTSKDFIESTITCTINTIEETVSWAYWDWFLNRITLSLINNKSGFTNT